MKLRQHLVQRSFRLLSAGSILLAPALIGGCVSTSDMETTKGNLAQLHVRSSSQERDISQLKERVDALSKETTGLSAMRESNATLFSQTQEYAKELQSLRGRFEENRYFIDKTLKDMTTELELQRAKISSLEKELKAAKGPVPAAETKEPPKPSDAKESPIAAPAKDEAAAKDQVSGDSRKLYDEAHIALKEKDYGEARSKFARFIKEYPKDPLVPNCYYWVGETYYGEKKYEDAILAYEEFLKKYPGHEKARGAMLKQGFSFLELGDKKTGKTILEMVVEKYPQTTEAEFAEKRLESIAPPKAQSTSKPKPKPADKKKR